MNISIENLVTISEANQDFSRVIQLADKKGMAIILKNDTPGYVLLNFNLFHQNAQNTVADNADVDEVATRILAKHIKAFEELAK